MRKNRRKAEKRHGRAQMTNYGTNRGTRKRVIWVQNADSRLFESAYFILRPGAAELAQDEDMIAEADRIVAETRRKNFACGHKKKRVRTFGGGVIVGSAVSLLLSSAAAVLFFLCR